MIPLRADVRRAQAQCGFAHAFAHIGTCAYCLRERTDLFWHEQDRALYCVDVFRCEHRYYVQGERESRLVA